MMDLKMLGIGTARNAYLLPTCALALDVRVVTVDQAASRAPRIPFFRSITTNSQAALLSLLLSTLVTLQFCVAHRMHSEVLNLSARPLILRYFSHLFLKSSHTNRIRRWNNCNAACNVHVSVVATNHSHNFEWKRDKKVQNARFKTQLEADCCNADVGYTRYGKLITTYVGSIMHRYGALTKCST